MGDKASFLFSKRTLRWQRCFGYLFFLCALMCAAIEPAISAFFLFWPK